MGGERRGRGWLALRHRAALMAVGVAALPLIVVWLSALGDATAGRRMAARGLEEAQRAAPFVGSEGPEIDQIAAKAGVWVRVIDADGRVRVDANHDAPVGFAGWSSQLFFGPGGSPSLTAWEQAAGPPAQRLVTMAVAHGGGASRTCTFAEGHRLLICEAALSVGDRVVYVVESSQGAIRSLHDVRYPLLKLTLIAALLALAAGAWLGWRMVRPIEQLRAQVLARSDRATLDPVALDRRDELGDLARAFNRLLDSLRQRSAANEAFAADLAHEVKNPVAAVRAAAERLSAGGPVDPERAARLGRVLREASDRLERLSNSFLELARAEAGLAHRAREAVDLGLLGQRLIERLRGDPQAEGVALSCEVRGACVVVGVPERLETVVENLVDNALRYAAQEGAAGRVILRVEGDEERVVVEVIDNGPGVAPEDQARVFQRFFSRRPGGTGLGLALCKAIVEAHGGEIELRLPGRGCVFAFWVPAGPIPRRT